MHSAVVALPPWSARARLLAFRKRLTLQAAILVLVVAAPTQAASVPTFDDPVALVGWLLRNSMHGFNGLNDAASAPVFSPGLRAAVRTSLARGRQLDGPSCGGDGDFILNTQENGDLSNVRLSAQPTAVDRRTVSASYDVDSYHREQQFMVVMLDVKWKLENIMEPSGKSLRRILVSCQ